MQLFATILRFCCFVCIKLSSLQCNLMNKKDIMVRQLMVSRVTEFFVNGTLFLPVCSDSTMWQQYIVSSRTLLVWLMLPLVGGDKVTLQPIRGWHWPFWAWWTQQEMPLNCKYSPTAKISYSLLLFLALPASSSVLSSFDRVNGLL